MRTCTTDTIARMIITETIGVVTGSVVRAKNIGHDVAAGLKSIVGGEIHSYSDMLSEARAEATQRMIAEAESLEADAVINVRFSTSSIMHGMAELLAYGTAVKIQSAEPDTPEKASRRIETLLDERNT